MPPAAPPPTPRTVLFRRRFIRLRGGHIKVRDYVDHVEAHPGFRARLWLTPDSKRDHPLWTELPHGVVVEDWRPSTADVLFLAGLDWRELTPEQRRSPPCPVVNLVQHTRHADPGEERFGYLSHPATRVCVSPQVAEAIEATGRVNGPVITIPNGVDAGLMKLVRPTRTVDVVVCGSKRPEAAHEVGARLRGAGASVAVLDAIIPRADFLGALGDARVAVFLPNEGEGFYLPALEAMALQVLVVCPALGGLESFLREGVNAATPPCEPDTLAAAALETLALGDAERGRRIAAGRETAGRHGIATERAAFHRVLESVVAP